MNRVCPKCSGYIVESEEDKADCCLMCGSLFYWFTPDYTLTRRRANLAGNKPYSRASEYIRKIFTEAGGTIKVRDLAQKMQVRHGTNARYVRLVLTAGVEFTSIGQGWWQLDLNFEI